MGTRNLTVVKNSNGETKIALYGQWDGYPSHSGRTILEFIQHKDNRDRLLSKLDNVEFITIEESDAIYKTFPHTDWENKDFLNAYPGLHRDTGSDIVKIVANSEGVIKTIDNSDFRDDTLFCEGIYEVDFSTNSFISTFNGTTKTHPLDDLPSENDYLSSMSVATDTIAA